MKKKRTLVISAALALLMFVSTALSGCGKGGNTDTPPADGSPTQDVTQDAREEEPEETEQTEEKPLEPFDMSNAGFSVEKIGSIDHSIIQGSYGVYYKNDADLYGVMTLDGKKDTGAIYTHIRPKGTYFIAYTDRANDKKDFDGLNSAVLLDTEGNAVISDHYATFDVIGDRFVQAIEVTSLTDSKDDALFAVTDRQFAIFASDDDTLYSGKWYIYDMKTGKKLDGVTGTNRYVQHQYGDVMECVLDDRTTVRITADGNEIPKGATILKDGCYVLKADEKYTVYTSSGKELFTYKKDDFSILSGHDTIGQYFVGNKNIDGSLKYFLVDHSGQIASAQFDHNITAVGPFLTSGNNFYDYDGKKITDFDEDKDLHWNYDGFRRLGVIIWSDDEIQAIGNDGADIFKIPVTDDVSVDQNGQYVIKRDKSYYSWKDKDFTISGSPIGGGLVVTRATDNKDLIDTVTGETVLTGYDDYEIYGNFVDGYYIYAKISYQEYDIYRVEL